MVYIRKKTEEYKNWLIKRNEKNLKRRSKKTNRPMSTRSSKYSNENPEYVKSPETHNYEVLMPSNFSLIDNTHDIAEKFSEVFEIMSFDAKRRKTINAIFFNLSGIKSITIDAVMYMVAVMSNQKYENLYWNRFSGSLPDDPKIGQMIFDSGFFDHVQVVNKKQIMSIFNPSNDTVHIRSANQYYKDFTKDVCIFIHRKLDSNRRETQILNRIILEMVNNVLQHAYNPNSMLVKNWYLFAKYINDRVCITFLDTGDGIPITIKRKFTEIINPLTSECDILYSSFISNRSNTQLPSRGNGLPAIHEAFLNNKISNLTVISGRAVCKFNSDDKKSVTLFDIKNRIYGTLYYWEINRNNLQLEACE